MSGAHAHRVLILDFGSQYTQLIARRVREAGVYCEIHPYDQDAAVLRAFGAHGIVLSGGPETVTHDDTPRAPPWLFDLGVPVLGICYGMQVMAAQLGGRVAAAAQREFGLARVRVCGRSALLDGIAEEGGEPGWLEVWMSHGDRVEALPPGFQVIASTEHAPLAAMADETRRLYGLQFHPEVTHTRQGQRILERFLHRICGLPACWTASNILADSVARLRTQLAEGQVIMALSGGVDSAVAAALLQRAVGNRLHGFFVDNGLLRWQEADQVMASFARLGLNVVRVEAQERFWRRLAGVRDPERKRQLIGHLFIEIFEEEARKLGDVQWLAQGTIYPDVIESARARSGKAHVIKSHHNVGGLPERLRLKLVEPLRELFKDEVRRLGAELGLPPEILARHPFPGPGLGVRILGEVKPEYADILRRADQIFLEELRAAGWYDQVSQAFAVFLPVQSVGVTGDTRHYAWVIALRAVQTVDFMTARWAPLPWELLDRVSRRICNEVPGVSRVVYDISGKPPATIEWE